MNTQDIYTRWKAITPAPWSFSPTRYGYLISAENGDPLMKYASWDGFIEVHGSEDSPEWGRIAARANADFISHAPDDIADLLQEVRRLIAENDALREEVLQLQSRGTSITNAIERERASVVALLRESQRMYQMHRSPGAESLVRNLADVIERGEHRREEGA